MHLQEFQFTLAMATKLFAEHFFIFPVYGREICPSFIINELSLSKRTLQRKLSEENTTFQKQLNNTREVLALHYINNTDMTTNDIAFLLGYAELNSFLRAFSIWTGKSVSEYREKGLVNGHNRDT